MVLKKNRTTYNGVIVLKTVIFMVICSFAGSVFSQTPMQLLASIDSPFESDTTTWRVSITGNGDINGDGYNDIVLAGQPLGSGNGRRDVYIYLGGINVSTTPDYIIPDASNPGPYHRFGSAIAYDADINGDGYCDLVVSETGYGDDEWGRVLVYFGGPDFDVIPDMIFDGFDYGIITWGLHFGNIIDISGDFNGDGCNDLVISSEHWNLYHYGQVNIFYGGQNLDIVCDWFFYGAISERFGATVSVGDLNGDGFSDLVSVSLNLDQVNSQCLKIFYGSPDFDNTCDTIYGEFSAYYILILIIEDFNNDSFADLAYYRGDAFYICWGSDNVEMQFDLWHSPPPTNLRSIYSARFNNNKYLCYGTPQLETFSFFRWDSADGCLLDYVINENYNPNAAIQLSYYLGDVNGDGHCEILLSNRINDPLVFKVFTTEYDSNTADDYIVPEPGQLFTYPNPFSQELALSYELKEPGLIKLYVYNIKGQLVAELEDGHKSAGKTSVIWNGKDKSGRMLPSGVYIVQLKAATSLVSYKKVTLCY